jgi:hypothetical protein
LNRYPARQMKHLNEVLEAVQELRDRLGQLSERL